MKRILIFSFMIFAAQITFGQVPGNDASYSVHNYKHPNKAAYAKKHKLDKSNVAVSTEGARNDNYKRQFKKRETGKKVVVKTRTNQDRSNRSYKHPYGL